MSTTFPCWNKKDGTHQSRALKSRRVVPITGTGMQQGHLYYCEECDEINEVDADIAETDE